MGYYLRISALLKDRECRTVMIIIIIFFIWYSYCRDFDALLNSVGLRSQHKMKRRVHGGVLWLKFKLPKDKSLRLVTYARCKLWFLLLAFVVISQGIRQFLAWKSLENSYLIFCAGCSFEASYYFLTQGT